MRKPSTIHVLFILISVSTLVAFSVAYAAGPVVAQASAVSLQISPPPREFPTPFGEQEPLPTPLPTVGPGQAFDQSDDNRPGIDPESQVGDGLFGYARLKNESELFLFWMTDENGTHYKVVGETSEILSGGVDPDAGYVNLVRRRAELQTNRDLAAQNKEVHPSYATYLRVGTIAILGGALVCALTVGVGCALGAIGLAAAPFWGSISQDSSARVQQNSVDNTDSQLGTIESDLKYQFRTGDPFPEDG